MVVIAVMATGCLGQGSAAPTSTCADTKRPAVALAVRLGVAPSKQRADCLARSQSAVFGNGGWGERPAEMLAINPTLQLWEARSLLYACNGCRAAVFSRTWMQQNHPDWILRTADGHEIHPIGHPDEILVDFANLDYQTLWGERVAHGLAHEGWTGVNVIDADNDPEWDGVPIDRSQDRAGLAITPGVRREYLRQALSVTRAVIKTSGYRLAAQNGPPAIVDYDQINSTDSVSVGKGFALLTGHAWTQLFDYFKVAFGLRAAPIVWDDREPLTASQRVYGLASYLLVQTQLSVYGVSNPLNSLYHLNLGDRDQGTPTQQGPAWTREYPSGDVAVNPSARPATVTFTGHPALTLPPFSAAILASTGTVRSW